MQILVVEDEKNLAKAIVKVCTDQKYQAEAVYNGADAVDYGKLGRYDVIILDLMLPQKNGFQVASELRKAGIGTPILMLTARDDVRDKVQGLDSGADDYLTKPFDPAELLARIRAMTRRQGAVQLSELTFGDLTLSLEACMLSCGAKQIRLSHKEFEVLRFLMTHPCSVVSKEDLIVKIWGMDSDAVGNNVEAYISFLRKKFFFLGSKVEIVSQRRLGYQLEAREC